jgi:hypothetical protein
MREMKDTPLDKLIVGIFLTVAGLLIMILHKTIKEWRDWWASRDWPAGFGGFWTGKHTRGGLIFTYAVIILFGLVLFGFGVFWIFNAFKP